MHSAAITSVAKPGFDCGALLPTDRCICMYLQPVSLDGVVPTPIDSAVILPAQLNGTTSIMIGKQLPTLEPS